MDKTIFEEKKINCPCWNCNTGWSFHSDKETKSCHDECKRFQKYIERKAKIFEQKIREKINGE